MQALRVHKGKVAPLDRANVDTDQIIPKQFLKRIERTGYGQFLFFDWRQNPDGTPKPDFVLNEPRYTGSSILLARRNFGCGSSREHAAWALTDYGFRVVIAPSFADIFNNNASKNGLLTIVLDESAVNDLFERTAKTPDYALTVDLEKLTISDGQGFEVKFTVDDFRRRCFLEGLDDIALTLQHEDEITKYEGAHR
jgi:3-isopropylmalate/(R)-2-methylmalate dehydratase small subunit